MPISLLASFPGHSGNVNTSSISNNGHLIATGGDEGIVRVWAKDLNQQLSQVDISSWLDSVKVTELAFSPDDKYLAISVRTDKAVTHPPSKILIWKLESPADLVERGCQWLLTSTIQQQFKSLCELNNRV